MYSYDLAYFHPDILIEAILIKKSVYSSANPARIRALNLVTDMERKIDIRIDLEIDSKTSTGY